MLELFFKLGLKLIFYSIFLILVALCLHFVFFLRLLCWITSSVILIFLKIEPIFTSGTWGGFPCGELVCAVRQETKTDEALEWVALDVHMQKTQVWCFGATLYFQGSLLSRPEESGPCCLPRSVLCCTVLALRLPGLSIVYSVDTSTPAPQPKHKAWRLLSKYIM